METVIALPRARTSSLLVTTSVAAAAGWLAYDDGSYGIEARAAAAIVIWWLMIVGGAFGLWRLRLRREATIALGAAAALALWTLASVGWSSSAETAFAEFDRTALYLGVLVLAVVGGRSWLGSWLDGLAIAISAIVAVALASRFFPGVFPDRGLVIFLPSSQSRLSFPLGYWNGLAIFAGMGATLLLGRAAAPGRRRPRAFALALLPAAAAAIYLASSRGGVVVAIAGVLALLALAADRWAVVAAVAVAALGAVIEIELLASQSALVNGPFGSDLARSEGRTAALFTVAVCAATGLAWVAVVRFAPSRRPPATAGRMAAAICAAAALVAVAVSGPAARFESFKRPPDAVSFSEQDFVGPHLLSGAGSGRWQFWSSALDEWRSAPLIGHGAGSFADWWAERGPIAYYIQDAHSLYLQTLGELGAIGGAILAVLVLAGLVGGARRALRAGRDRPLLATATAGFVAWAVGAGIDWMWELTAVTVVGLALLGLALAGASAEDPVERRERQWQRRRRFGTGVLVLGAGWVIVCAQAVPLVAKLKLDDSQAMVRRGNLAAALADARTARNIQPWAASPYLQLALVAEQRGDLVQARRWIGDAIDRSGRDWRLWLVEARLETKAGHVEAARAALNTARRLNPRSPLFTRLGS